MSDSEQNLLAFTWGHQNINFQAQTHRQAAPLQVSKSRQEARVGTLSLVSENVVSVTSASISFLFFSFFFSSNALRNTTMCSTSSRSRLYHLSPHLRRERLLSANIYLRPCKFHLICLLRRVVDKSHIRFEPILFLARPLLHFIPC